MLFLSATFVVLAAILIFQLTPDPQLPEGFVTPKPDMMESFRVLLRLLRDERVVKMYGQFWISACAAATA